jgi:GT2 family glycosyltransferase
MKTLSIVMLTHNNGERDKRCLSSWLPFVQLPQVKEWLILDNGSTDNTVTILKTMRRQVAAKTFITESPENLGCAGGRDVLFNKARGDYILSLDSDALLTNRGRVMTMMKMLEQNDKVGVVGDHGGWVKRDWTWCTEANWRFSGTIPIVSGYCQMFRRSALEQVQLDLAYNPYWLEDADFCLQFRQRLRQTCFRMSCGIKHEWSKTNSGTTETQREKWAYFKNKWYGQFNDALYKPDAKI